MGIEITGSELLAAQLALLPEKVQRAVEKQGVTEANKLIVTQLKSAVSKDSGALQKSVKHVVRKYKGGRIVVGVIGPDNDYTGYVVKNKQGKRTFKKAKKGEAYTKRPAKYAHLVEYGTAQRKTESGANRGRVTATNFTQKTLRETEAQVTEIFANAVKDAVNSL